MRSRLLALEPPIGSSSPRKSASGSATHHPCWPARLLGIIAVLRVDPTEASMIFRLRRLGDAAWTVTFGATRGLLTYWVLQPEQLVVLLDLTWAR
jgi:hypothetical protein